MTAQEIKELRQRSGWTQERLARELGVSVMTVSRWETGKQKPIPSLQHALDLLPGLHRSKRKNGVGLRND